MCVQLPTERPRANDAVCRLRRRPLLSPTRTEPAKCRAMNVIVVIVSERHPQFGA
jgi:hypothetical protein